MLKGWRTIIFNGTTLVVTVGGVAAQYVDRLDLTAEQQLFAACSITVVNTVGNMILRKLTTTPLGKKQ